MNKSMKITLVIAIVMKLVLNTIDNDTYNGAQLPIALVAFTCLAVMISSAVKEMNK